MEPRGRSGFSLVELMVALGLTGVLLAGLVRVLLASLGSWSRVNESLAAERSLRRALDAMAEDLRMLGCRPPEPAAAADSAFTLVPGRATDELSFLLDPPWPDGAEGPGLLAARPRRRVRYAVVPENLDETDRGHAGARVPCLVRSERADPADPAAPRAPAGCRRVVAEHVTGFRVDLEPGGGIREAFASRRAPALVSVTLEIRGPAPGAARHRKTLRIAPRGSTPGGTERERGGAALVLAFMLLVLMAAAGLATSRNLLRELRVAGEVRLGEQAAAAAESGLEWFLAGASAAEGEPGATPDAQGSPPGVFGESPPEAARQSFELRARSLSPYPPGVREEDSPPPGRLWRVTATGRCRVPGRVFTQVRELIVLLPQGPGGAAPPGRAPPQVLAWRIAPAPSGRER